MSDTPTEFAEIGDRLRQVRTTFSALTRVGWAGKNGFAPTQWNTWETGVRRISVDAAIKLCNTYGLTLDYIYRGRRDGLPADLRDIL